MVTRKQRHLQYICGYVVLFPSYSATYSAAQSDLRAQQLRRYGCLIWCRHTYIIHTYIEKQKRYYGCEDINAWAAIGSMPVVALWHAQRREVWNRTYRAAGLESDWPGCSETPPRWLLHYYLIPPCEGPVGMLLWRVLATSASVHNKRWLKKRRKNRSVYFSILI